MKPSVNLIALCVALSTSPVSAHVGPENGAQHLFEHSILFMALALPVYFGVRYLRRLKTSRIERRSERRS
ncbi:MAG: hypothetical protein ABW076_17525 [Candidatus Thiodiazotropha sp.]